MARIMRHFHISRKYIDGTTQSKSQASHFYRYLMYSADFSQGSCGLYVIYNTKERKTISTVYRDTLMKGKFIYDIKPNPNNKEELFCTLYACKQAVVAKIDVPTGEVSLVSETSMFEQEKPKFFFLDDN